MVTTTGDPLGDLVVQTARALRRRFTGVLEPWDLSPHQARALRVVSDQDGLRLSDLAAALRIAPRSATEVADGLEARGLVRRLPDPNDRRAVCVELTGEGRRVRGEVEAARTADAAAYFGVLDADERAALARILGRLRPGPEGS